MLWPNNGSASPFLPCCASATRQQIEQHRIAPIAFQRRAIKPLGFGQIALAMMRKRLIDELLYVHVTSIQLERD